MNDPAYYDLIRAGYAPEQILSCLPCKCKETGRPVKDCTFPTHRGGVPINEVSSVDSDMLRVREKPTASGRVDGSGLAGNDVHVRGDETGRSRERATKQQVQFLPDFTLRR